MLMNIVTKCQFMVIVNKAAEVGTELFMYLVYVKSARGVALFF